MRTRTIIAGALLGGAAGLMSGAAFADALPEVPVGQNEIAAAYAGNLLQAEVKVLEIVGLAGGLALGAVTAANVELTIQQDADTQE